MNILSAIYAGQMGFLRATDSMAERANRIANWNLYPNNPDDQNIASDIIGMKVDAISAKANLRTISVSDNLLQELVQQQINTKK